MAEDRVFLPQSGGGLLRYNESGGTKLQMSPQVVLTIIVVVIVLALVLHTKGFGLW